MSKKSINTNNNLELEYRVLVRSIVDELNLYLSVIRSDENVPAEESSATASGNSNSPLPMK